MKENIKTKKFFISFAISAIIFSLSAIIIGCGLLVGQRSEYEGKGENQLELNGRSFNILIAMCDYAPELFDDYDPEWLGNAIDITSTYPTESPSSPLVGHRKVYMENMAILRFDKERGEMSVTPVPGATLVAVKGLQVRLEEVAGRWGIDMLIQKVHAITGLDIDHYAVFTPDAPSSLYVPAERSISIPLSGTLYLILHLIV